MIELRMRRNGCRRCQCLHMAMGECEHHNLITSSGIARLLSKPSHIVGLAHHCPSPFCVCPAGSPVSMTAIGVIRCAAVPCSAQACGHGVPCLLDSGLLPWLQRSVLRTLQEFKEPGSRNVGTQIKFNISSRCPIYAVEE